MGNSGRMVSEEHGEILRTRRSRRRGANNEAVQERGEAREGLRRGSQWIIVKPEWERQTYHCD